MFSLEVKTQTKTKNAKGSCNWSFFISVFAQQQHHTAAGRDKQRDAQGDRQAGWQEYGQQHVLRRSEVDTEWFVESSRNSSAFWETHLLAVLQMKQFSCLYGKFKATTGSRLT